MRTHSAYNVILIAFASLVCVGSLKLGFGSFADPGTGFMPCLASLLLIVLSVLDLIVCSVSHWKEEKKDAEIWSNIHWGRLLSTTGMLVLYVILVPLLGFSLPTIFLLFFLFRLIEDRPWWHAALGAITVTGIFYLGFGVALGAQLPKGVLGF
jgi:hypothetical protein